MKDFDHNEEHDNDLNLGRENESLEDRDYFLSDEEEKQKNSFFGKKNASKDQRKRDELAKLEEKIENLEKEKLEINDKFLRLYSEFDNYKKRTQKEKLELIDTASERVIIDILPVIDDFERAIKANENIEGSKTLKEGFEIIYHKLLQVLHKNGVEEISAKGEPFDTDFHEAITHVPVQNKDDEGKVIDVIEKGYKIKDKVIRYAKVVVGDQINN